jgi:hypothetical protein
MQYFGRKITEEKITRRFSTERERKRERLVNDEHRNKGAMLFMMGVDLTM